MTTPIAVGIMLRPLDLLFFRDGRPFGESSRVKSGVPTPQMFAGALRTSLLAKWGVSTRDLSQQVKQSPQRKSPELYRELTEAVLLQQGREPTAVPEWSYGLQFRGPWLALCNDSDGQPPTQVEPLLPTPLTLVREADKGTGKSIWSRSDPKEKLPGWSHPLGWQPLWHNGGNDAEYPGGYLTLTGLQKYLEGGVPDDGDWYTADELFARELRTGIVVNPDRLTTETSQMYGIEFLALRKELCQSVSGKNSSLRNLCLYGEVLVPDDQAATEFKDVAPPVLPLGGEGRLAELQVMKTPVIWPAPSSATNVFVLLSPVPLEQASSACGPVPGAWKSGNVVRAASFGTPLAISGWDLVARGPKPTRFFAPAGSVFFVEPGCGGLSHNLCAAEADSGLDAVNGWGFALPGRCS